MLQRLDTIPRRGAFLCKTGKKLFEFGFPFSAVVLVLDDFQGLGLFRISESSAVLVSQPLRAKARERGVGAGVGAGAAALDVPASP